MTDDALARYVDVGAERAAVTEVVAEASRTVAQAPVAARVRPAGRDA